MKIYGYESEGSDLISLSEITLKLSLEELKDFVLFLERTSSLMEKHGDDFGHEHLNDFYDRNGKPDIIITK